MDEKSKAFSEPMERLYRAIFGLAFASGKLEQEPYDAIEAVFDSHKAHREKAAALETELIRYRAGQVEASKGAKEARC